MTAEPMPTWPARVQGWFFPWFGLVDCLWLRFDDGERRGLCQTEEP